MEELVQQPLFTREGRRLVLTVSGTIETPNLSTMRAAVEAGLGLTCRTAIFLRDREAIRDLLPPLPDVSFIIAQAHDIDPAKERLASLATDVVREL